MVCDKCEKEYPSKYYFYNDAQTKNLICKTCSAELESESVTAFINATKSIKSEVSLETEDSSSSLNSRKQLPHTVQLLLEPVLIIIFSQVLMGIAAGYMAYMEGIQYGDPVLLAHRALIIIMSIVLPWRINTGFSEIFKRPFWWFYLTSPILIILGFSLCYNHPDIWESAFRYTISQAAIALLFIVVGIATIPIINVKVNKISVLLFRLILT